MNRKGFTLIELLGVIVVLAIVGSIVAIAITSVIDKQKNEVYKNYESTLKSTVENFIISKFKNNDSSYIPTVGNNITINVEKLISENKIESLKDPNGGNCNDSYVIVTRNNNNSNGNISLNYKVCLVCSSYKTTNDC